ncbi:uncharacterized protein coil isoform X2 [Tenebrio molitor]|uniref:uncharacterized protein coil isoform X2 n=1 Tax=Tenebrio molitor TaxID=7067 RepID=UPI003624ABA9
MRITVNLGMFFHDHKSLVRIYVNKNLKCIQDVEKHISNIFNVHNFYLKSENHYLPPTEDVRVLNDGDIVWAIPDCETKAPLHENNCIVDDVIEAEEIPVVKKKKKKKKDDCKVEENPFSHGKKRKCDMEFESNGKMEFEDNEKMESQDITCGTDLRTTNSKHTKLENGSVVNTKANDCLFKKPNPDSFDSSKDSDIDDIFENKKNVWSKPIHFKENVNNEKKINIVKTIIISNKQNTPNDSDIDILFTKNSDKLVQDNDVCRISENNPPDTIDVLKTGQETSCISTCNSDISDGNIEKRKRQRIRKRKRKVNNVQCNNLSFEEPVCHVPHTLTPKNPQHIKFNDDEICDETNKELEIPKSSTPNNVEDSKKTINDIIEPSSETIFNCKKVDECILKQPITQNTEPRTGDIIAFKILRISESYTPEVSSNIVGKVLSYETENKEITFEVFYGQEQCVQPLGKFSVDTEQPEQLNNNIFHCVWSSLLEPRLLFP